MLLTREQHAKLVEAFKKAVEVELDPAQEVTATKCTY
jgi:hypothetical protein